MAARMKDIAKLANVSETTVSLVINNKPSRVSEKKKKEILKIAKDLNYHPNFLAQGLAKKETHIIGLIIPDIENMFFASLAKEIERLLYQENYFTILTNSNDNQSLELNLIDELINVGVDGLLIVLSNESYMEREKIHNKLDSLTIPFVLLDRSNNNKNYSQVYFDNYQGGYIATKFLIDQGHRDIGFVKGPSYIENVNNRYLGYLSALKDNDIKTKYAVTGDLKYLSGYSVSDYLLLNRKITGVVVANDLMLLGLLKRATELKIDIPDDLSIVGYDRSKIITMYPLEITTIELDIKEISSSSVDMLFDLINTESYSVPRRVVIEPKLKKGKSTKAIKPSD